MTQAYVYGRSDQPEQARHALQKLEQVNRNRQFDPAPMFAVAYVGMDNKDEAFYDPLRTDSRFQDLLRRVRLAQ